MKKKYVINYEDEHHSAMVASDGNLTQVGIEHGPLSQVDFQPVLAGKAISLRIEGRMYLVHLTGLDNKGKVMATIDGRPVHLAVMDELKAQALESLGSSAGSGTIAADIPGLVIEIKVTKGQIVHPGDPVIVVEAMKMQNELCAAVGGKVVDIPVQEGQPVNPGDPLVIIEPEPGG